MKNKRKSLGRRDARRVLADLKVFEQGLEGLRPFEPLAAREIHSSEVSGGRRVRKDLPKLSEGAGDRRRFAENLFLCVRIGLDNVQRRRAPRYSRCQERPGSASCTQPKEYARPHHRAGPMRSRVSSQFTTSNVSTRVKSARLQLSVQLAS